MNTSVRRSVSSGSGSPKTKKLCEDIFQPPHDVDSFIIMSGVAVIASES